MLNCTGNEHDHTAFLAFDANYSQASCSEIVFSIASSSLPIYQFRKIELSVWRDHFDQLTAL